VTQTIDDYIGLQPPHVQAKLHAIRSLLRSLAPAATEKISYGIPTFALGKNVFHFAAFKSHIGLYPGSAAIVAFASDLARYKTSKGAIQIPLDQDLPLDLIGELLRFNMKALLARGDKTPQG
jgi:uncharacterized protein YdhG (YjbR/CyaY superfamily)